MMMPGMMPIAVPTKNVRKLILLTPRNQSAGGS